MCSSTLMRNSGEIHLNGKMLNPKTKAKNKNKNKTHTNYSPACRRKIKKVTPASREEMEGGRGRQRGRHCLGWDLNLKNEFHKRIEKMGALNNSKKLKSVMKCGEKIVKRWMNLEEQSLKIYMLQGTEGEENDPLCQKQLISQIESEWK